LSDQSMLLAYARKYSNDREGYLSWSRRMHSGLSYPFNFESEFWPRNLHFADKVLEAEDYADEGLLILALHSYDEGVDRLDFNSPYPQEFIELALLRMMQLAVMDSIPYRFSVMSPGLHAEYLELKRKIQFWNSGRSTYPDAAVK
jgi:hypothetical protein